MIDVHKKALEAARQLLPDGFVIVPKVPTEAMLAAANKASLSNAVLMDDTRFACERATYEAAIAAYTI